MKLNSVRKRWIGVRSKIATKVSEADARMLCYALGPLTGALFLRFRPYPWAVRFHAVYSILLSGVWALAWGALRLVELWSPWFLGTLASEIRFIINAGSLVAWALLLISARDGSRCALIPPVHELAVKLARRYERYEPKAVTAS